MNYNGMKDRYLSIKELAEFLNISERKAAALSKSKKMRSIKGAIININSSSGKYEILRVDKDAAVQVYSSL